MAILNFQKPDKVIMIDSTDFEGKFEFRPLEPGYGLTHTRDQELTCTKARHPKVQWRIDVRQQLFPIGLSAQQARRGSNVPPDHYGQAPWLSRIPGWPARSRD